jgi:hypothetical protein
MFEDDSDIDMEKVVDGVAISQLKKTEIIKGPAEPWIYGKNNTIIYIPEELYESVYDLVFRFNNEHEFDSDCYEDTGPIYDDGGGVVWGGLGCEEGFRD